MRVLLLFCVALILAMGLMMVFNTSSAEILDRALQKSTHQALLKQLLYASIGCFVAYLSWQVGYKSLLKLALPLLILCTILLVLVFVPGIGQMRNGAHRWIGVGSYTFQPSEFIKLIIPLYYIEYILSRQGAPLSLRGFLKIGAILAIPLLLVMIEPDNGTAVVIGLSLLPLFFITHIPFRYWALPFILLFVLGGIVAYNLPYVRARIAVYLNPELDLKGKGHQPHQAKIAAGSGKLFGKGPGSSLQKLDYLPEAQNDYIAAIFAEEFGFLGISMLIIFYMLIGYAGYNIAFHARDKEGCYLATAMTFLICLQAFLNLGVVSGLLPSKGVNLPFFSQGGTSLMTNIIGIAILLEIASSSSLSKADCKT